jgi:hypothetical protein
MGLGRFASLGLITAISISAVSVLVAQAQPQPAVNQPVAAAAKPSLTPLLQEADLSRNQGYAGLEKFLKAHQTELKAAHQSGPSAVRDALDRLCQQKDCYSSQLYWHTDLATAQAEAKASNKPILSLRLLGNLNEDLSCANSRFFRVALYPNAAVGKLLRDRYVLHWESVRPAPKITIDYGNGRKLERTITGNSIHYLLSPDGQPLEALPGLYGPQAFLKHLERGLELNQRYQSAPNALAKADLLSQYHRDRRATVQTEWQQALTRLNLKAPQLLATLPEGGTNAATATPIAATKSAVEIPFMQATMALNANQVKLLEVTDAPIWTKLAQTAPAQLDAASRELMRSKLPPGANLDRAIAQFEANLALDSVRNEYTLHSQLHQWFIGNGQPKDLKALNQKVYAELFLSPDSDPWLGMLPQDVFAAVDGGGVR